MVIKRTFNRFIPSPFNACLKPGSVFTIYGIGEIADYHCLSVREKRRSNQEWQSRDTDNCIVVLLSDVNRSFPFLIHRYFLFPLLRKRPLPDLTIRVTLNKLKFVVSSSILPIFFYINNWLHMYPLKKKNKKKNK